MNGPSPSWPRSKELELPRQYEVEEDLCGSSLMSGLFSSTRGSGLQLVWWARRKCRTELVWLLYAALVPGVSLVHALLLRQKTARQPL